MLHRTARTRPRVLARATARVRLDPSFLVLGEMKCGTSSLYAYLSRHPQIRHPYFKEPYFFSTRYDRGINWYRSNFPLAIGGGVTFESSVYYLAHPLARERIREHYPEAKLVVMVRDPIARTQSHWNHSHSKGRDPLPFPEALDAEPARLAGEVERLAADPSYVSYAHIHHAYASRSRYADALRPWMETVPPEQLHVIASEDLFQRPHETLDELQRFLGLSVEDLSPYEVVNSRTYERMDPVTRERLAREFEQPNRELYELLGRDLGWPRPTS